MLGSGFLLVYIIDDGGEFGKNLQFVFLRWILWLSWLSYFWAFVTVQIGDPYSFDYFNCYGVLF
jgi:hypothetical protein